MVTWRPQDAFDVLVVGKRLAALLLVVAVYYLVCGLLIRHFNLSASEWGSEVSLINTLILSLLMSFRNGAAYARWWEGRGQWGLLVNDSRNLAAKCAAYLPADVLTRSRIAEILVSFPDALKRHLRNEPFQLRDLPGFEHEDAAPTHVPLYLGQRLHAVVADWKRDGHIDVGVLLILDRHARGLLDVCGACERIRNTPLSASYKGLLRAGLVLNVLISPWLLVPESGMGSLPMVLLVCFFLFGVELIDSIVEEPFGRDRDDLDLDRYCQTIREGVQASLSVVSITSPTRLADKPSSGTLS